MNRMFVPALSEFVGTFFLALAALSVPVPFTIFAVGIVLLVAVYVMGPISGAHLNPAVTVGLIAARQFPFSDGILYIVAQIAAALVAKVVVSQRWIGTWGNYSSAGIVAEFIGFGI